MSGASSADATRDAASVGVESRRSHRHLVSWSWSRAAVTEVGVRTRTPSCKMGWCSPSAAERDTQRKGNKGWVVGWGGVGVGGVQVIFSKEVVLAGSMQMNLLLFRLHAKGISTMQNSTWVQ